MVEQSLIRQQRGQCIATHRLGPYRWPHCGGSYPSAEVQSAYSTVLVDRVTLQLGQAVLIQLIQFRISTDLVYTVKYQNSSMLNISV